MSDSGLGVVIVEHFSRGDEKFCRIGGRWWAFGWRFEERNDIRAIPQDEPPTGVTHTYNAEQAWGPFDPDCVTEVELLIALS
ncbi:MAG: hypothetical protein AAB794_03980 [Patescibacteria group bacterium]